MKIFTLALFFLLALVSNVYSQTCGMLLFTENGESFSVYTNGTLQNQTPVNQLKLVGFPSDIVKLKIKFIDTTQGTIEKTMYLRIGFIEHHKIKKNAKGKWSISFDSDEQIPAAYANTTTTTVITINNNSAGSNSTTSTVTVSTKINNCASPMNDKSFYNFYGHFKSITFDSDQLKEAKEAVARDCFSSKQIKTLLSAMVYESSRLEFAKYAYPYVYDKGAYAVVKEGFSNSISGDELDTYIKSHY